MIWLKLVDQMYHKGGGVMTITSAQNVDYILKHKNNTYLGYGNKMLPMA